MRSTGYIAGGKLSAARALGQKVTAKNTGRISTWNERFSSTLLKMTSRETIKLRYKGSNRDKTSLSNMKELVEISTPVNFYQIGSML